MLLLQVTFASASIGSNYKVLVWIFPGNGIKVHFSCHAGWGAYRFFLFISTFIFWLFSTVNLSSFFLSDTLFIYLFILVKYSVFSSSYLNTIETVCGCKRGNSRPVRKHDVVFCGLFSKMTGQVHKLPDTVDSYDICGVMRKVFKVFLILISQILIISHSKFLYCQCEQRRFWRDSAFAQS